MSELSVYELETQHGELLPEREALGLGALFSFNHIVVASNQAEAVQALTVLSVNKAVAIQTIFN